MAIDWPPRRRPLINLAAGEPPATLRWSPAAGATPRTAAPRRGLGPTRTTSMRASPSWRVRLNGRSGYGAGIGPAARRSCRPGGVRAPSGARSRRVVTRSSNGAPRLARPQQPRRRRRKTPTRGHPRMRVSKSGTALPIKRYPPVRRYEWEQGEAARSGDTGRTATATPLRGRYVVLSNALDGDSANVPDGPSIATPAHRQLEGDS